MIPTYVVSPTEDYTVWRLECPDCGFAWFETTHELWGVTALTCPECGNMAALPEADHHGDSNAYIESFDE